MKDSPSEKQLIELLKAGEKDAADELIGRFYERVSVAAKKHLRDRRIRVTDADDIAASVFESLWRMADQRTFGQDDLKDTQELWRLLCKLVSNKSKSHYRRETALKRGGGKVRGESAFHHPSDKHAGIHNFKGEHSPPTEIAIFEEEQRRLMNLLEDETLVQVAAFRLEGYKVKEIAKVFDKSVRWVGRKLELIRDIWQNELPNSE